MRASFLVLGPLIARNREAMVSVAWRLARSAPAPSTAFERPRRAWVPRSSLPGLRDGACAQWAEEARNSTFPSVVGRQPTENLLDGGRPRSRARQCLGNRRARTGITDLGNCLTRDGRKDSPALGPATIEVEGVRRLLPAPHAVLPDRIETGTYAIGRSNRRRRSGADAATSPDLVGALILLSYATPGVEVGARQRSGSAVATQRCGRPAPPMSSTAPFPGFPTDLQAQYMALMAVAHGTAHIRESDFRESFHACS
jgi:UDP-N-acetylglucosamine 1-carboxyvinyltransferase